LTGPAKQFAKAIVRIPAATFAGGLTTANLGVPDYSLALVQFNNYCSALSECGLELIALPADENYPDSTFVEDTAVFTDRCVILTRPGARVRRGEVELIAPTISRFRTEVRVIEDPGTLDGGDVCRAGSHFFIGLSQRTNEEGAQQLSNYLAQFDYTSSVVDIRTDNKLLHLKSGIAYLSDDTLVLNERLSENESFASFERITVPDSEGYACNCVAVNDKVLIASGFAALKTSLDQLGYKTVALEMSEFQKMDGGLSCLSLRF
jgi:dimethylargininase